MMIFTFPPKTFVSKDREAHLQYLIGNGYHKLKQATRLKGIIPYIKFILS